MHELGHLLQIVDGRRDPSHPGMPRGAGRGKPAEQLREDTPGLHPPEEWFLATGALASGAMITTTIQRGAGLTPRQREVVALIAAGCSNDEVGERLGISPRTAKAHSDTLRSKLGVSRRRQIPVAFRVLTGEDPLSASLGALHRRPGA